MNDELLEAAQALVNKADNDLQAARIGLQHGAPLDTVCFHVQQAAEKLLKAALVCEVGQYPFTHDLRGLLMMAVGHYPSLEKYRSTIPSYTVYAVVVRYDASVMPEIEEARDALENVEELRAELTRLLPSKVWNP